MAKDWTQLYKKYKGKWVALASDEVTVLGSGMTVLEAMKEARSRTETTPYLTHIPETLNAYVGIV